MSAQEASKVRLCADILPSGRQCRQIALKDQPWCHAHLDPQKREHNAFYRQFVAAIPGMTLLSVAVTLSNTVHQLRARTMPPLHASAILDAAAFRLEELIGDLAPLQPGSDTPAEDNNSSNNKRLHAVPMK